jgi:hypothetical protein
VTVTKGSKSADVNQKVHTELPVMVAISFSLVNTAGIVRFAGANIVLCVLLLFCKVQNKHILHNTSQMHKFVLKYIISIKFRHIHKSNLFLYRNDNTMAQASQASTFDC